LKNEEGEDVNIRMETDDYVESEDGIVMNTPSK
jgi:hypothetical protein